MKATTQGIYNLITNERFTDIATVLKDLVEKYNWTETVHQEFTYEDLLDMLPSNIDIIKSTIEDESFEYVPFNIRNAILKAFQGINTAITQMESGNAQLPTVMSHTEQLSSYILSNRLDFKAKNIPLYDNKVKQYKDLTKQLNELIEALKDTEDKQKEYNSLIDQIKESLEHLSEHEAAAEKNLTEITGFNESISNLKSDSEEKFNNINSLEKNSMASNSEISTIKENSNKFFEKVEEYVNNINTAQTNTDNIIAKNEEQTAEIDKQLDKAAGVSLFHTFEDRKKQLRPASWGWLGVIVASVIALIFISSSIVNEFSTMNHVADTTTQVVQALADKNSTVKTETNGVNSEVNWIWFALKITLTFPLIYLIIFATTRYSKERRLMEEYAFKSAIALALKPYSDLVAKLGEEKADEEYRKFLIKTIQDIFIAPTDKVFGSTEKNISAGSFDTKTLNGIVDALNKLKPSN
jgi:predicted  nucleic acid-binding Zn-ribbon protein/archaellin